MGEILQNFTGITVQGDYCASKNPHRGNTGRQKKGQGMTRQREPAQGGSIEELEAGREYATQNGFYKIIALDGGTVRFEVMDRHRASAGGVFVMAAEAFRKMIQDSN